MVDSLNLDCRHKADRGAHAYWLEKGTVEVRPDHILNLIHYEVELFVLLNLQLTCFMVMLVILFHCSYFVSDMSYSHSRFCVFIDSKDFHFLSYNML